MSYPPNRIQANRTISHIPRMASIASAMTPIWNTLPPFFKAMAYASPKEAELPLSSRRDCSTGRNAGATKTEENLCRDCYTEDGITVVESKKGTGARIFATWMTFKLNQYFGRGRVFPRYVDSSALEFLEQRVDEGDYLRADGSCLCPKCGKEYRQHPSWEECDGFVLICTGLVVKL